MNRPSWIGYTLGGRYSIEALLGQGGMSAVYRAYDPNLRRPVAIKLIHSHLSADPEFIGRFEAEAAAVAQLRHPNIVQVFDFNHDADVYYMVMEYLPGESLQDRLKALSAAQQRFPVATTANILATVADAVAYAHERGTIHRDLKPANVMLMPQGQPVLTDFGVAKILGGQRHTATGAVIGTPAYMSPEQVRGEQLDGRADIYSLGIMLYEMAAGRPPFEGDSAMTVMLKHINEPVPDIRKAVADVPESLVTILDKALAKQPEQRFQSAAQLAAALRSVAQNPNRSVNVSGAEPSATIMGTIGKAAETSATLPPAGAIPPRQEPLAGATRSTARGPAQGSTRSSPPPVALIIGAGLLLVLCLAIAGAGALVGTQLLFPAASATSVTRPTLEPTATPATSVVQPTTAVTIEPTAAPTSAPTTEATPAPTVEATLGATELPSPTSPPQPTAPPLPVGMILVPAGTFNMGSTALGDTQPVHPVNLDAFYIDQFEVVNELFHQCVTAGACTDPGRRSSDTRGRYYDDPAFGSYPVNNVSWQQATNFCKWQDKRLPTEAEWEYAAVGTDGRAYPWGNDFNTSLVPAKDDDTQQVGSLPGNASPFGAEDMSGNVAEWTADWYAPDYYASSPADNPTGPASGTRKVYRGGAYGNADPSVYLAARRFSRAPSSGDVDIGFRCVMTAPK
jgi:serine/threonine protein kinase/formylglycine-generating enzyme required for sulfatase activity